MSAGLLCLPQQASKLPCLLPPLSPPQALSPHRLLRISYQPKSLSVREVTGGFEGLSTDRSAPTHSEACRGRATGPWRGGSPFLFHPSPRSEEGISRRRLHPRHYGHPGCVCVCVCAHAGFLRCVTWKKRLPNQKKRAASRRLKSDKSGSIFLKSHGPKIWGNASLENRVQFF